MNNIRFFACAFLALSFLATPHLGYTQTPEEAKLVKALHESFNRFSLLTPKKSDDGEAQFVDITLNKEPLIVDGSRYDGFRFRATREEGASFVWMFKSPENLHSWFIVAETGLMKGFANFYDLDGTTYLQSLSAASLETGKSYLIWFRFKDEAPSKLSIAFTFAKLKPDADGDFNAETLARALAPKAK